MSQLLDPQTLARVKGLVLRSRQVVDGVLSGIHKSPHHGSSIEFSEHKEYTPGDEIRHVDWKAFGRLDKYYVKRFEQESNLRAYFIVDSSASMAYGRDEHLTKFEYASVMAVSLAYLLLGQQDAVGVMTCGDAVREVLPPRARGTHLSNLAALLEGTRPEGGTSLEVGLAAVSDVARRRGLIFLFSDFFGEHDASFKILRQLIGRGHQVTAFHVLDGDEIEFPFEAMTLFEGLETRQRLLVEPKLIRAAYLKELARHREDVRTRCLRARVAHVPVDTREPPAKRIVEYLNQRESLARAARAG